MLEELGKFCCGTFLGIAGILATVLSIYMIKKKDGFPMKLRKLKKDNDAVLGLLFTLLIFIVGIVVLISIISLVFGIFTFIGICLLAAAAFILFMKKGVVTFAPKSPFLWLLVIGIILVVFGQVVMDIGSIDLSAIPGMDALHNLIRVDGGGEI